MSWKQDEIVSAIGRVLGVEFEYKTIVKADVIIIDVGNSDITFSQLESLSQMFKTKDINYSNLSDQGMGSELTGPRGAHCQISIGGIVVQKG